MTRGPERRQGKGQLDGKRVKACKALTAREPRGSRTRAGADLASDGGAVTVPASAPLQYTGAIVPKGHGFTLLFRKQNVKPKFQGTRRTMETFSAGGGSGRVRVWQHPAKSEGKSSGTQTLPFPLLDQAGSRREAAGQSPAVLGQGWASCVRQTCQ